MAVNTYTFEQISTILAAIHNQVTGNTSVAATNTADWVSVAQATLRTGVDPVMGAISKVIDKTIFSNRPYSEKFKGLEADAVRWGSHTRKLTYLDKGFEPDERINLVDGSSIDAWEVSLPQTIQTNFYGDAIWEKSMTIFRDQLDTAMRGPDEFAQFLGMIMQGFTDEITQARESLARYTLGNLMAATYYYDANNIAYNVVHLVSRYNAFTGASPALTWSDICGDAAEYERFMRFTCAVIMSEAAILTERSELYHLNPTIGGVKRNILRHTPYSEQNFYILNSQRYNIDTLVKSVTFNDDYLSKVNEAEVVNFWQGLDTPDEINLDISCMKDTDGDYQKVTAVNATNVLGVIVDREACGYTIRNQFMANSPYNPRGNYINQYYHATVQWWNDNTENCVLFTLD